MTHPQTGQPAPPEADGASLRQALCRTMADVHRRGWCDGTGGNFSVVLQRDPLLLLMAPSGVDKGRVRSEELVEVDRAGRVRRGDGRASAETPLHVMLAETTGAGSVLHTHSLAATLLSELARHVGTVALGDLEMLKGLEGVHSHATTVRIPVLANDQDLERLSDAAQARIEAGCPGILVAGHGLYAWGSGLDQARRHLETLEFLLELQWRRMLLRAVGADREPLP